MLSEQNKQTFLSFLCIAFLVLTAAVAAYSGSHNGPEVIQPVQPPGDHQSQETRNYQYGARKSADLTRPTMDIKCDPYCTANNSNQEIGKEQFPTMLAKFSEDPIELITAIIAFANIVLAILICVQIRDGRKSSERQLRAYVGVEVSKEDKQSFNPGGNTTVILMIANRGATPAYKLKIASMIEIHDVPLIASLDAMPDGSHSITLGPSSTTKTLAIFERALNDGEQDAIIGERKAIYIWGRVTYTDAFGNDRFTNWRMEWAFQPGGGTHGIVSCPEGNDAD
jgi:hypothetical protein